MRFASVYRQFADAGDFFEELRPFLTEAAPRYETAPRRCVSLRMMPMRLGSMAILQFIPHQQFIPNSSSAPPRLCEHSS